MSSFSVSCFWALLSPEHFRFLYLPRSASKTIIDAGKSVTDLLMHRSLLDFVHPDELSSAQTDFTRFLSARTPAGSITRCRLRSFSNLALVHHISSQTADTTALTPSSEWAVVDIVMYIATETFVLAFFHDPDYFRRSSITQTQCGQLVFEPDEVAGLFDLFDRCCAIPSSASADRGVTRLFQVHEGDRLHVSWPRRRDDSEIHKVVSDIMRKEIPFCISNKCSKSGHGCTHHHYSSSIEVLTTGMVRFERIIIPYGHVIFAAFQITAIPSHSQQQMAFYKHYVHCNASLIQKQQEEFVYACNRTIDFRGHTRAAIAATSNSMSIDKLLMNSATSSTDSIATHRNQATLLVTSKSATTAIATVSLEPRVCAKCHTHSSPEWRKGPSGSKTLCNACGLRFSRSLAKKKRLHQTEKNVSH